MPNCNKLHHQSGRRSDETMDDDSDDKDSKRKSRNLSEKKRRDQFNLLVNELSAMVSTSGRKMDKSTVLKATISFLKSHNELAVRSKINEIQEDWKPTFLTNEEFTHLVLEAVDGFIIIFSTSGQIYYASESTTSLLGYLPKDILDISIFDLVCEEDHTYLYDILATPHEDEQISFSCHLKRCWSQFEKATFFELVNIFGYFRPDESTTNKASGVDTPSSSDSNKNLVFVGTAKIQTPLLIKEMPLIDSIIRSEFTSRHSLEWKFLFLDHRAPPIIGYLPFELLGTSGYEYYHVDDLEKVINCHEKLMQKGEGTSCYYRFLTKGQQWIWLQTRFYITYHQWNSKPEFVVCTHRVVNYLDVTNKSRKESVHHHHHHLQSSSSIRDHDVETHQSTSSAAAWRSSSKSRRNSTKKRQDSDSTSMSADSPTSKYSTVTEKSINKSHVSLMGNLSVSSSPHPLQEANNLRKSHESLNSSPTADGGVGILHQHQQQEQQFLEPAQYGTTINNSLHHQPSSSALESYPAHSLSTVEETVHQNEIQVDFHRKQAELQAIIGQQQQELLRVSEQLLMARLALFQQQTTQEQIISQQSGEQSYQPSNSPVTVSSTTATSSAASISVPTVSLAETDPLQPATILYTLADSNSNNTQN